MQIWSATQLRAWDAYTIANEPIASIDLMERAAMACYQWILKSEYNDKTFTVYCGKGNNGGDGLAIARLLHASGNKVQVIILEYGRKGSADFQKNLTRIHDAHIPVIYISSTDNIHPIPENDVVIDALFGTGLDRPLDALASKLVQHINASGNPVISIDMPSGLFTDTSANGQTVIKAHHTLSFQCYKLSFLLAENESFTGEIHILDIGLHPDFPRIHSPEYRFIDKELIARLYKPRNDFAHKGSQGHAALLTGQPGMMGAAILSSRACLRAGVGKLSCFIPEETVPLMQIALPEAICHPINKEEETLNAEIGNFDAWGAGPGLGKGKQAYHLIAQLLTANTGKLVLDADALNLLSEHPELLHQIPESTIITPHVGEWTRLAGKAANDFDRLEQVIAFAQRHKCIVVMKGRYTFIADPAGGRYFNTTGNSGLAKAGTGDVLTGIITSFLAQGYPPLESALLGVYMHGLAADHAIKHITKEALLASDVVDSLSKVVV
jgi:NAD(P)H-hydrate epimerase